MADDNWERFGKDGCPLCGHADEFCGFLRGGNLINCGHPGTADPGNEWRLVKESKTGVVYVRIGSDADAPRPTTEKVEHVPPSLDANREIADDVTLDRAYRLMIDAPPLETSRHRLALLKRGIPGDQQERLGYRTLGQDRWKAVEACLRAGIPMTRVPGLFFNEEKKPPKWSLAGSAGMIVPCRRVGGQIVALKVRRDGDAETIKGSRYLYLSSKDRGGPSCGARVHVPVGITGPCAEVRVTEGELKADVSWLLSQVPTISIPGTPMWERMIPVLRELGAQRVRLALDMDARTKPAVARDTVAAWNRLLLEGFQVVLETWDQQHKGVDDALVANSPVTVLSVEAAAEAIEFFRKKAQESPAKKEKKEKRPEAAAAKPGAAVTNITNAEWDISIDGQGNEKKELRPLTMKQTLSLMLELTKDWPRQVGHNLFVHDKRRKGVDWLENMHSLYGYLASSTGNIYWHDLSGGVSRSEVFCELKRTATSYRAVELYPHDPPIEGHYYALDADYEPGNGEALQKFLDYFTTETPIDRDLILAALLTCLWGGPPGKRPAFLITSAEGSGRGAGKTTVAECIAEVVGGCIAFRKDEDADKILKRLLSVQALNKRCALLDNIKSPKFSWAELEALITAKDLSGHKLYEGEGSRPNTLTWFITLNGASLSPDLAQRVIPIHVVKPTYSGNWWRDVEQHLAKNRRAIICDLLAVLRQPCRDLGSYSRWGPWDQDILSKLPEPADAAATITERQGRVNIDREEAIDIEDFFGEKLRGLGYDTASQQVFVPSQIVCEWYNDATKERRSPTAATRRLELLADEDSLRFLRKNKANTWGRGWIFGSPAAGTIKLDLRERLDRRKANNDSPYVDFGD